MIDFSSVTIPVYLSAYMRMGHASQYSYENDTGRLLTCHFNIRAGIGNVASLPLMRTLHAANLNLYKYLQDLEKRGKEEAFAAIKEEFEQIKRNHSNFTAEFPVELTADNALSSNVEICYLYQAGQSEVYFVPANIAQLSKAFIASAHTGALVNIDVDTRQHSSRISLYMPEAKSKSSLNKPRAEMN